MICRIWRGWTTLENADAYQTILTGEVMPSIHERKIDGFIRHECMRRNITTDTGDDEVEFTTIIWFESIDAVKEFVGDDYETAHVPAKPRTVLKRFDARSTHYEIFDDDFSGG